MRYCQELLLYVFSVVTPAAVRQHVYHVNIFDRDRLFNIAISLHFGIRIGLYSVHCSSRIAHCTIDRCTQPPRHSCEWAGSATSHHHPAALDQDPHPPLHYHQATHGSPRRARQTAAQSVRALKLCNYLAT